MALAILYFMNKLGYSDKIWIILDQKHILTAGINLLL